MAISGERTAGKRGARAARVRLRLATLLAALAVFAQLAALPYHHPVAGHDLSTVAVELTATFGPVAVLCTQSDDSSTQAPDRRQGGCDAGCPLCQFASHAVLLEAPPHALPEWPAIADLPPPTRADLAWPLPGAIRFAQPRAPPTFA